MLTRIYRWFCDFPALRRAGCAALAVVLAGLVFTSPARAEWLEARTKHFVVTGDLTEADLRRRSLRLEQFDAAMRFVVGGEEGVRVNLYLLGSMDELQKLAANRNIGGFYIASAQAANAFMPQKITGYIPGFSAESVLFHEYTHHMLGGNTREFIPRWASEGLAEMFMTAKLAADGSVTIGATDIAREDDIRSAHRWTVEELFRKDSVTVPQAEVIERYSLGWALCHYLWLGGSRPGQYAEFIKKLNETGDQVKAAQAAFGNLQKLDSDLDAYLHRNSIAIARLSAAQIKPPTDVAIRRMSAGEIALIWPRMRSAKGVTKAEAGMIYAVSHPVAIQYPDDPVVQTWFAEMAFDAGKLAEADAAADNALRIDPNAMMPLVFKGWVAARGALVSKDPAAWKTARALFLKANRSDPNHPLPFVMYYDSFGAAGEHPSPSAVTGLMRAAVLMPQDMDVRIRAGVELLRADDKAFARTVLAPAAYNPHGKEDNAEQAMIVAIDAGLSQSELLAKAKALRLTDVNDLIPAPDGSNDKDHSGDTN